MTLLWVAVVCFALYASAIGGDPSSDVTGAPVMAVRGKRFVIPYNKCPWGTMQTLWGCVLKGRAYKRPESSNVDMPRMHSHRITRTRGIFRRRNRLGN